MDVDVPVSLDVLSVTNDARSTYGLRQQDYQRYREYCARKIHRVRKTTGLLQGRKRFEKRPIVESIVSKDSRALQVLLFEAERSWAYAMQLKADSQFEPRKKHHLVKRLVRAADAAKQLEQLCQGEDVDSRTSLDTQAYAARLAAFVHFERQQWQAALDLFASSRAIYEKLALVAASPAHATLCQAAIDEIDPNIRYCAYNLKSRAGQTHDIASLLELRSKSAGAGHDLLAAKLDSLLAENMHVKASKIHSIPWRGIELRVANEPLMATILEMQALAAQIVETLKARSVVSAETGDVDEEHVALVLAEYDKLLGLGWDAYKLAEKDVKDDAIATIKVKSSKSDEHTEMLRNILSYVAMTRLEHTFDRGMLLVKVNAQRIRKQDYGAGPSATSSGAEKRPVRRDELVRLDISLLQTVKEMREVPIVETDLALAHFVEFLGSLSTAQRLAHTADIYAAEGKLAETLALLGKAGEHLQQARAESSKIKPKTGHNAPLVARAAGLIVELDERISSRAVRTRAEAFLASEQAAASITDGVADLSLDKAAQRQSQQPPGIANEDVSMRMETFFQVRAAPAPPAADATGKAAAGKKSGKKAAVGLVAPPGVPIVQPIPPGFEAAPFKPVFYDLAFSGIGFPTGNIRALAKQGGKRQTRLEQAQSEAADAEMGDGSAGDSGSGGAAGGAGGAAAAPGKSGLFGVIGSLWGGR
ncbi:signal recognition particle subunit srp68 [Polyrhizophydium stewartii]|uniref:Signal recognition particle subunit SRP68 n=1 Tax=Polyrhizophydium stewartii TaxID=2732419 RepID=A0ABR4MX58_9FUNG